MHAPTCSRPAPHLRPSCASLAPLISSYPHNSHTSPCLCTWLSFPAPYLPPPTCLPHSPSLYPALLCQQLTGHRLLRSCSIDQSSSKVPRMSVEERTLFARSLWADSGWLAHQEVARLQYACLQRLEVQPLREGLKHGGRYSSPRLHARTHTHTHQDHHRSSRRKYT